MGVRRVEPVDVGAELVGDQQLLDEPAGEEVRAPGRVLRGQPAASGACELLGQVGEADDRPGDQVREERDERRVLEHVAVGSMRRRKMSIVYDIELKV